MRIMCMLAIVGLLQACASNSATPATAKKDDKVVSVFNQSSETTTATPTPAVTQQATTPSSDASLTTTPSVSATTSASTTPDVKGSPKDVIKSYTSELQNIKADENTKGKKRDQQIAQKVRGFFDFQSLAEMSLGTRYSQLSKKKQMDYSTLFTGLIEKSYLQRSKNLVGNYKLSYGDENITGNKASVSCNIYKEDVDLQIVYELHKVGNNWMIYNIVFDQVNLVKNYQTQFNQIIGKSGIDGLLNMMRKKLKENSSDVDANL